MLFGRIFIVCVVGIGVPLTRALMYAPLFLSTIVLMERTKDDNRQQWNERNY